jgi:formylglycine-generating enzyme required for sulfatase activity
MTETGKDILVSWVRVPAGLFLRGCPEGFIQEINRRFANLNASVLRTYPVRKEPLDEFWMSVHPITNAQYHAFVRATGHRYPAGWRGTAPPYPKTDPHKPVTGVTWQDSLDFAEWIGARLPKRAEYEKACRGEDGRIYPWGEAFDVDKCNTAESKIGQTTAVDAYPAGASVYGIMDLVGNVWEWTADEKEGLRMTVGGSYEYTCEIYGAGFFDMSRPPDTSGKDLGFRLACSDVRALKVEGLKFC